MNNKRLIGSVLLGMISGFILFTILITINMKSIDYSKFNEPKSFKVLGFEYLSVEKDGDDINKKVDSIVILVTSIALGGLSYLGLGFYSKNKKGGV